MNNAVYLFGGLLATGRESYEKLMKRNMYIEWGHRKAMAICMRK